MFFLFYFFFSFMLSFEGKQIVGDPFFPSKSSKKVCMFRSQKVIALRVIINFLFYLYFQDEEDVKAIARLFADMGDSYVELIATGMHIYK